MILKTIVLSSIVDKISEILIKNSNIVLSSMQRNTLNWMFKILRHQEQMISSSSVYEKIYLQIFLKEFLKLFQCLASCAIHTIYGYLDLLFKALHQEIKRRREENSRKACMGTLSCGRSLRIYRHLLCGFLIKTLIIMYISTNSYRPYVCDPLGPYISLVNNSIDQITPYWSTLINYPHQHIN